MDRANREEEDLPRAGSALCRLLYAILWLMLLVYIAWPAASICISLWILLQVRKIETSFHKIAHSDLLNRSNACSSPLKLCALLSHSRLA